MKTFETTRRRVMAVAASLLAGRKLSCAQKLAGEPYGRITPVQDNVNVFEVEAMAQRKLDSVAFTEISGSDRSGFDRITFRPRMMVDTAKMDLSIELFGQTAFTPILVGPVSQQKRFHPEAELAMARGASAGKAFLVVSDRSSYPIDEIAAEAKTTLWYQVYPQADLGKIRERAQRAVKAGCKALCVTIGAVDRSGAPLTAGVDWSAIDRLRQGIAVPVLLKGIISPEEARKAIAMGVQGIIVSNYAPRSVTGLASSIEMLPSIVSAAGGKIPVLIDGNVRRGSDVVKALALGAKAVLLGRPPVWGLAAYGAAGVQQVVELLQTELARDMAMCGMVKIGSLDASVIKIHRR